MLNWCTSVLSWCAISLLASPAFADYILQNGRVSVVCADDVAHAYCLQVAQRTPPLLRQAEQLLGHQIKHVNLVVKNVSDFANGSATSVPTNTIRLYTVAPREGSLLNQSDWLTSVLFHELIHIVQVDAANGVAAGLHAVFGRHFWTFPGVYPLTPRWTVEGMAVWGESSQSDGRATSPYYRGQLRMLALDNIASVQTMAVNVALPHQGNQYLVGSAFMRFISQRYGEQAVQNWVQSLASQWLPGFYGNAYSSAFGNDLVADWALFQQWLKDSAKRELDAINAVPVVDGRIQAKGWVSQPVQGPDGELWFIEDLVEQPKVLRNTNGDQRIALPSKVVDVQYRKGQWQALRARQCGERLGTEWLRYQNQAWWVNNACEGVVSFVPGSDQHVIRFDGQRHWLSKEGVLFNNLDVPGEPLAGAAYNGELAVLVQYGQQREIYRLRNGEWQRLNVSHLAPKTVAMNDHDIYFVSGESQVDNLWRASDKRPVTNVMGAVVDALAVDAGVYIQQLHPELSAISYLNQPKSVVTGALPAAVQSSANIQLSRARSGEPSKQVYQPTLALRPTGWQPSFSSVEGNNAFGAQINLSDKTLTHKASVQALTDLTNSQLSSRYRWPHYQAGLRLGQVNSTLSPASNWAGDVMFQYDFDAGLGVVHELTLATLVNNNELRFGAGWSVNNTRWATFGVAPRQGAVLAGLASWGASSGRLGGQLTWHQQFGPVYSQVGGGIIWDGSEQAQLVNGLIVEPYQPNLEQVKLVHPGVNDLPSQALIWQLQSETRMATRYNPRGIALLPVGFSRAGVSVQGLLSGTVSTRSQTEFSASLGLGVFLDWRLAVEAPVRTELIGLYGALNAEPALALKFSSIAF